MNNLSSAAMVNKSPRPLRQQAASRRFTIVTLVAFLLLCGMSASAQSANESSAFGTQQYRGCNSSLPFLGMMEFLSFPKLYPLETSSFNSLDLSFYTAMTGILAERYRMAAIDTFHQVRKQRQDAESFETAICNRGYEYLPEFMLHSSYSAFKDVYEIEHEDGVTREAMTAASNALKGTFSTYERILDMPLPMRPYYARSAFMNTYEIQQKAINRETMAAALNTSQDVLETQERMLAMMTRSAYECNQCADAFKDELETRMADESGDIARATIIADLNAFDDVLETLERMLALIIPCAFIK